MKDLGNICFEMVRHFSKKTVITYGGGNDKRLQIHIQEGSHTAVC